MRKIHNFALLGTEKYFINYQFDESVVLYKIDRSPIKCRGKNKNNEWLYGYLFEYSGLSYIFNQKGIGTLIADLKENDLLYQVQKNTIGQYVGCKDKNNKDIYEGDVVRDSEGNIDVIVYYEMGYDYRKQPGIGFGLSSDYINIDNKKSDGFLDFNWGSSTFDELEVVGNIYDNPELFEKEEEENG